MSSGTHTFLIQNGEDGKAYEVTAEASDVKMIVTRDKSMPDALFAKVAKYIEAALEAEAIRYVLPEQIPDTRRYINTQGKAEDMKNNIVAALQKLQDTPAKMRDSAMNRPSEFVTRSDEEAAEKVVAQLSVRDAESLLGEKNLESMKFKLSEIVRKSVVAARQQARGQGHG